MIENVIATALRIAHVLMFVLILMPVHVLVLVLGRFLFRFVCRKSPSCP